LRPLAKTSNATSTKVMPRDHHIDILPSGLIHVTGGKWTTYRNMAEHAVDKAIAVGGLPALLCRTRDLPIHGCTKNYEPSHLSVYGTDAAAIRKMMAEDDALATPIHPNYPYTFAEVKWMTNNEMAITVEDILGRRIRLLFLDAAAAIEAAPGVAAFMAREIEKDQQWVNEQVSVFSALGKGYLLEGQMK